MPLPVSFDRVPMSSTVAVADTCFIANVFGFDGRPDVERDCIEFMRKIACSGSYIGYTYLVEQELYRMIYKRKISEYAGGSTEEYIKPFKEAEPETHKKVISCSWDEECEMMSRFNKLPGVFATPFQADPIIIMQEVRRLQIQYGLQSVADATHIAIANREAAFFATVDKDFLAVTGENVTVATDSVTIKRLQN
jgi:hypothetical protein